jgi:hypothetical protein
MAAGADCALLVLAALPSVWSARRLAAPIREFA